MRTDAVIAIAAFSILLAMFVAAVTNVSRAWDVGDYHLPFAARLAHVVSADSFVFHRENQARFEGFPLLGERLQGLLWRFTGRAEATNLVAFVSLPLLAWFSWRRFRIPAHVTVVVMLGIPLVHTHMTSAYVDLPANAAACVLVMIAIERWVTSTSVTLRDAITCTLMGAIAANMKTLLHPLVGVTLVVLIVLALREYRRSKDESPEAKRVAVILVITLPLVFATPLLNLYAHHNPYFPIRMNLLGLVLPGTEPVYASTPNWLANAPKPVRFACSVLELGLRPFTDPRRWTIDQWMPSDSRGVRMGGYFSFYMAAHLALLAWRAIRNAPSARRTSVAFVVLTLLIAQMPQSHELRYYLVWPLTLITLNLWLARQSEDRIPTPGGDSASRNEPTPTTRAIGLLGLAALTCVLLVTRADYARPSGTSLITPLREKVDEQLLESLEPNERLCVRQEPWNLAWAREFHPGRTHTVIEAEGGKTCPPNLRAH